jgi:ParB family transcriptional regulator, chromosome partitioning protein
MTAKTNPTSDAFAQVSRKPTADDLQQAQLKSQLAGGGAALIASTVASSVPAPTVRAMQKSLEDLQAAGMRVDAIEAMLETGEHAVDLHTGSIEQSAINDRFDGAEADDEFCASIKAHGQIVPILVRPFEGQTGRYQIVYGRRRLSAAKKLGITVRAFIRSLTHDESVALQAIENAQRKDLTFIERAVFALSLDEMGFKRDVIGSVLSISKSKLSEMISIPRNLGMEIIQAIGAARAAGYRPWTKLSHLAAGSRARANLLELIQTAEFKQTHPDSRLNIAIALLGDGKPEHLEAVLPLGTRAVSIRRTEKQTLIAIDRHSSAGFADFIEQKLPELFSTYQAEQSSTG